MANENHYNTHYIYTYTPRTASVKNIFVRVLFTTIVLYSSTAVSMDIFIFYFFDKRLSFVVLYYIIRSVEVRAFVTIANDQKK